MISVLVFVSLRRHNQHTKAMNSLSQHSSSPSSSSFFSSSICGVGGNPAYRTSAFEAVCTLTPVLVPRSSPEALHVILRERPLLAKGEVWTINSRSNLATQSDFHVIAGFFNMPQSCDMGRTVLLPLLRKACRGFFRPKNPTASAGFEPANLGTRGQHDNHETTVAAFSVQLLQTQSLYLRWQYVTSCKLSLFANLVYYCSTPVAQFGSLDL
jgi:hypothetical protein